MNIQEHLIQEMLFVSPYSVKKVYHEENMHLTVGSPYVHLYTVGLTNGADKDG